jgi:Uma2 family endonuclease
MDVTALVSVQEYLQTSYEPDCELVDGHLVERNLGEKDHGRIQVALAAYFYSLEKRFGILVITEQRVQVRADRFRAPDVCIVAPMKGQIVTESQLVCIEILSKDDRMQAMQQKINEYLDFGVPNVWIIDPKLRRAFTCSRGAIIEAPETLTIESLSVSIPVAEIFAALD